MKSKNIQYQDVDKAEDIINVLIAEYPHILSDIHEVVTATIADTFPLDITEYSPGITEDMSKFSDIFSDTELADGHAIEVIGRVAEALAMRITSRGIYLATRGLKNLQPLGKDFNLSVIQLLNEDGY